MPSLTPDNRPQPQRCAQRQHSPHRCLPPAPADKVRQSEPSRQCGQEEWHWLAPAQSLSLPDSRGRRHHKDVPKPGDLNCPEGICHCTFTL